MEKIPEILKKLEAKHDIQILYAVEAGSRAWKLDSIDSDYDIRFIFKHNDSKKYISLKSFQDNYDGFSEDRVYDWQGWDIKKALSLLHQMNPSLCEWLYSPIIYYSNLEFDFQNLARKAILDQGIILPLLYHYRSMAMSNFKAHIDGKENVKIKKYLYVIRPAGMFIWLLKKNRNKLINFEIDFNIIFDEIKDTFSQDCFEKINEIIEKKKFSNESDLEPRVACVDEWINGVLGKQYKDDLKMIEKECCNNKKIFLEDLDQILFRVLNV